MKKITLLIALLFVGTMAQAQQTLEQAMDMNPKIRTVYEAMKDAAGVDCDLQYPAKFSKVTGPDGKVATTFQAACFDPLAYNPSQLGQVFITFYGTAENKNSPVGELIEMDFEVWK